MASGFIVGSVMAEKLGKITAASYGFGGYQGVQFGLHISMQGDGWGVSDFWGFWADDPSDSAKWSKQDQIRYHGETADRVCKLLQSAKVTDVAELKGVPVEVTFIDHRLNDWRVLKEVL